ncbi:endonuclease domain-containing protein [Alteriqipengyuania sp.]
MSAAPNISSPLAGEEGARARQRVGRRGGKSDTLSHAKEMRQAPTDAERRLWSRLRAKRLNGWKFRRQQPIGRFIVDFVCYEARLIVEVDGSQHADKQHDKMRDKWLSSQGFRVLRFWNNQVMENEDGVVTAIAAALQPPLPNPSPARGEGLISSPLAGEDGEACSRSGLAKPRAGS